MAKRWSVTGLLLATGLMSGHALAVVLDLDKPFKPQAAQGLVEVLPRGRREGEADRVRRVARRDREGRGREEGASGEGQASTPATPEPDAIARYQQRYAAAFAPDILQGLRIAVYQQSSVARDLMAEKQRRLLQSHSAPVAAYA